MGCTKSIAVFQYDHNGQRVYLIDTPGFNDTTRSDIDTLEILATYLGASYANGVRIHGIIMLHSISSNRMSGLSRFNLTLLKAICGLPMPTNLAIVTTMWPERPDLTRKRILEDREKELATEKFYFGELIAQGAGMFRHYENGHRDPSLQTISAQRIVSYLLGSSDHSRSYVLQLQREIVDEIKSLGQTTAGLAIAKRLQKALHEDKKAMKTLESETTGSPSRRGDQYTMQLQTLKSDTNKSIQKAEQEQQKLTRTMEDFHEAEKQAIEQRVSDLNHHFQTQLEAKEKEFQELQALYDEQVKQTMRHSKKIKCKEGERSKAKCSNKSLKKAKDNVDKTRKDRERFREYTTQAVGGVMNGIAAGAVAGGSYSSSLKLDSFANSVYIVMGTALCIAM
ncbi:hypothetical protein NW768_011580 [Fusarium equiseti]|uniref:G domain-containing protein n=1 Tax=Fusarium equiseti TaxID=61235 RepID=A0ABQ8QXF3_FUSEQ|nr:hypothetical protein NW768_011580 [Fusarium equiseti]